LLIGVRDCPRLVLDQSFAATEIQVSRNVTCDTAARWIVTATTDILLSGHPYQREGEVARYHHRDGRASYDCAILPDTEFVGEHDTAKWFCEPPGDPFAGRKYDWTRQPSNCKPCEGFPSTAYARG
jgi:hypothetical protein